MPMIFAGGLGTRRRTGPGREPGTEASVSSDVPRPLGLLRQGEKLGLGPFPEAGGVVAGSPADMEAEAMGSLGETGR